MKVLIEAFLCNAQTSQFKSNESRGNAFKYFLNSFTWILNW